jgi:hypothetical protein
MFSDRQLYDISLEKCETLDKNKVLSKLYFFFSYHDGNLKNVSVRNRNNQ